MFHIQVKSSLALDTLCFLEKRLLNETEWMNEKQIEEIKGKKKYHNLQELLMTNDTWEVK